MEMREFALKVQKAMTEVLGDEYEVRLQEVQKNNGVVLQGLLILSEKQNVSPTIYLKPFWEAYENGATFAELIRRIIQIYREDTPKRDVDMEFFREFDKVKERICYRLVNEKQNRELLERIPHVTFLDLAICFYYAYEGEVLGQGTILIYNTHMKMWNTTTEELMQLAQKNTPRLFSWELSSMEFVIREFLKAEEDKWGKRALGAEEEAMFFEEVPMQILTNRQKLFGAISMLYPEVLEQIAEVADTNLYIIPSSIHEVLLMPDRGEEEPSRLRSMIWDVNRTQLEPEEVLSNSLYYYDRVKKKVELA